MTSAPEITDLIAESDTHHQLALHVGAAAGFFGVEVTLAYHFEIVHGLVAEVDSEGFDLFLKVEFLKFDCLYLLLALVVVFAQLQIFCF